MFKLAEQSLKLPQLSSTLSNPVASVMGESNILQAAADKINQVEQSLMSPPQLLSTLSNPVASVMGESNILQGAADKIKEQEQRLKNLAYMQARIVRVVVWFTKLFFYAKKLFGPFKPVVEIIERIVKSVLMLVLEKYFHVPAELLKFVDSTVGGSATKIDSLVPPVIGQVSSGAISAAQKAAGLAAGVATEVQSTGVVSSASGLFKQVSSEAISAVQNAPQVAAGVANKVQHAKMNEEEEQWLKYLAFVQVITLCAVLCFTNPYVFVKERSGPLKPVIKFVEGMVKKVFRFVFDQFFDVLVERLKSGDPTVGEFVMKIDDLVHPGISQVSSEVISAAQKAAGLAGDVYTGVQNVGAGVVNAASGFMNQVSSDAISAALKAPGVIGGMVSEVQHAGEVIESVTKIDNLVPPIIKQVSYEAISASLKAPVIAGGVAAELLHAGTVSTAEMAAGVAGGVATEVQSGAAGTASGFIKQVSSEAISAVQKASSVGESVTMIDNLVPSVIKEVSSDAISSAQKSAGMAPETQPGVASAAAGFIGQVSSDATSAVQNAPVLAGGVAAELPHTGLLGTASGLIKQVSSEAASTAQKATGVAEGVATEARGGVASVASGFLKQTSSNAASASASQKAPGIGGGFSFGLRF